MSANASLSRKLRFGPYAAPRFRYGATVVDEARGEVVVVALSAGRIPWPLGRLQGRSQRGLILYRDLARAVRREAAVAVCYWWGVTPQTVTLWRKALGVVGPTDGERAVRAEHGRRNWSKVKPKFHAKAQDPERRAKISAARIGKKMPPSVAAALRKANTGRPLSEAHRAKMSAAHRKRGTRPPWLNAAWSADEDALLAKLKCADVAKKTGRTLQAVHMRQTCFDLRKTMAYSRAAIPSERPFRVARRHIWTLRA